MNFAKGSEQNYTDEIFKINKVVRRTPRSLYELEDLNGRSIEVQIYGEELTPIPVTRRTSYKIDKILTDGEGTVFSNIKCGGKDTGRNLTRVSLMTA